MNKHTCSSEIQQNIRMLVDIFLTMVVLVTQTSCHGPHDRHGKAVPHACNIISRPSHKPFHCDAILKPDVHNVSLLFPPLLVDPNVTNYYYMIFDLSKYGFDPNERYHIIALQHHTTSDKAHHVVTYACGKDEITPETPRPVKDWMVPYLYCYVQMSVWVPNEIGDDCFGPEYGMEIGKFGLMKIYIQIHYDNPERCNDVWDMSGGMTLYYTKKLRPNNAKILIVARDTFEIPPGLPSYVVTGTCSQECTAQFTAPITAIKSFLHMHSRGRSIRLEQRRNGTLISVITKVDRFENASIHQQILKPPARIHPGDQLTAYCEYSTLDEVNSISFGMGTSRDEMCIVYLMVYPGDAIHRIPMCGEPRVCRTSNTTVLS